MGLLNSLIKTLVFGAIFIALILSTLDGIAAFLKVTNLTLRGIYDYLIPLSIFYASLMFLLKFLTQKESLVHVTFYTSIIHISFIILLSDLKITSFILAFLAASFLIIKNKKRSKKILDSIPEIAAIYNGTAVFKDDKNLLKAICAVEILNLEKFNKNSATHLLNVLKTSKINVSIEFRKHKSKTKLFILTWCMGKNFEEIVKKVKIQAENLSNYLNLLNIENQVLLDEISIEETVFSPILNWTIKKPNKNMDKNHIAVSLQGFPLLKANFNNFAQNFYLSIILSPAESSRKNLSFIPLRMLPLIGNKEIFAMLNDKWNVTIYLVTLKESTQLITSFLGLKAVEVSIRDVILRRPSENSLEYSLIDILRLFPWINEEELRVAVRNG